MQLNDFSSVFELLCGYNFVNAIDNQGVLKILSFSTPVNEQIDKLSADILRTISNLQAKDPHNQQALDKLYQSRFRVKEIKSKNTTHDQVANYFYLLSGILCFFILVMSGFVEQYKLLNGFISLFMIILPIWILLKLADKKYCEKKSTKIKLLLGMSSLFILMWVQSQWHFFGMRINYSFFWLTALVVATAVTFVVGKDYIIGKHIFVSFYIFAWFAIAFLTNAWSEVIDIYAQGSIISQDGFKGWIIGISFVIGVTPLSYDLVSKHIRRHKLTRIQSDIILAKMIDEASGGEIDPIDPAFIPTL